MSHFSFMIVSFERFDNRSSSRAEAADGVFMRIRWNILIKKKNVGLSWMREHSPYLQSNHLLSMISGLALFDTIMYSLLCGPVWDCIVLPVHLRLHRDVIAGVSSSGFTSKYLINSCHCPASFWSVMHPSYTSARESVKSCGLLRSVSFLRALTNTRINSMTYAIAKKQQ